MRLAASRHMSPRVIAADVKLGNPDDEPSRLRYLDALKRLKEKGFVAEDDNRHLHLTEAGDAVAHQVMNTRQVLIRFLHNILEVDVEQAEQDACKIEHLLSHETCHKIVSLVRLLDSGDATVKKFLKKFQEFKDDNPVTGENSGESPSYWAD